MAGGRLWEIWEDALVRATEEAPRGTLTRLAPVLGRSLWAVHARAYKLGVHRGAKRLWSKVEDVELMKAQPVARVDTRASAGRTPIQQAARALGRTPMAGQHRRTKLLHAGAVRHCESGEAD